MFSGGTQYSCEESDENEFSEEAAMKRKLQWHDDSMYNNNMAQQTTLLM